MSDAEQATDAEGEEGEAKVEEVVSGPSTPLPTYTHTNVTPDDACRGL